MSTCLKKEMLLALVDRELAPSELESAERHIADCASCRQKLDAIRATSLKVNALVASLAPSDAASAEQITVIRIPEQVANPGMRWAAVASVGLLVAALALFVMIRWTHTVAPSDVAKTIAPAPAQTVEKKEVGVAPVMKPAHVAVPKAHAKMRQFQALDNGAPIETGMIYRVSLPAGTSRDATATQSARRIPAEVIVDEFGKVRAIRFLQ
jgi:anti-sigma factor RsiW